MDFSQIPDNVFLKILQYLSFKQQVRLRRVDKCFRRMCILAIASRRSLSLKKSTLEKMGKMGSISFRSVIDICARTVESIDLGESDDRFCYNPPHDVLSILMEFTYPRLIELEIRVSNIYPDVLRSMLENSPNLKILKLECDTPPNFPEINCQTLEILEIWRSNSGVIRSLTGKLPNLRRFSTELIDVPIPSAVIDDFVHYAPNLQNLGLTVGEWSQNPLPIHNPHRFLNAFPNLWQLFSMTSLEIKGAVIREDDLTKVATFLPQILELRLCRCFFRASDGIGALSTLKELRVLKLGLYNHHPSFDIDYRRLSQCNRLEDLQLNTPISSATFSALIKSCPDLGLLSVHCISGMQLPEIILESFYGIGRRNVRVYMLSSYQAPWLRKACVRMLEKLREEGVVIIV